MKTDMTVQSFVIRIWLEEASEEGGAAVWRGHITHVATRQRAHLRELHQILTFVAPYLEQMGIRDGRDAG